MLVMESVSFEKEDVAKDTAYRYCPICTLLMEYFKLEYKLIAVSFFAQ